VVTLSSNPTLRLNSRLWEQFVALADCSDEQIRRFAEEFGPLERPSTAVTEPVSKWRRYAGLGRSIAEAGMAIKCDRIPDRADLCRLGEWCFGDYQPPASDCIEACKMIVAQALGKWVNLSRQQMETAARWSGNLLDLSPVPSTLLGLIGAQIANVLGDGGRVEKCSNCGDRYNPKRRATRGYRRYCRDCKDAGVDHRDAMRDSRARRSPQRRPPQITS
jgi:hypothetical protein